MRRRNNIAAILLGFLVLAASSTMFAKDRDVKLVFCVSEPGGSWSLQRYKPLIDPQAKTVFAEMSLADHRWLEFRLRRFSSRSEVQFDYKFNATGQLNALEGTVVVFGSWKAEANLLPDPDGRTPSYRVLYSRNDERVQKPDDAEKYVAQFNDAPVYLTIQSVPCAARMQEAERMNATQE